MPTKIILLNFTEKESETVSKAGYDVERGTIGGPNMRADYIPFYTPHPIYEYDILFYNSHLSPETEKGLSTVRPMHYEPGSLSALENFSGPPHVRISFIGKSSSLRALVAGGLSFVGLTQAEENVSDYRETHLGKTFEIEEVHRLIAGLKGQIEKVGQFFNVPTNNYPFFHKAVLLSRSGQQIAGYGTTYNENTHEVTPRYMVLPLLRTRAQPVIQILQCLEKTAPSLFPDRATKDWLNTGEFLLPEERQIDVLINKKMAETQQFIELSQKEKKRLSDENAFVRALLVAKEDPSVNPTERLSGVVKKALEYLEFGVEDIDQKIKSAIKKEDFWVTDASFLAITEVTGTINKNPKIKEFNDILARLATIYKRKGELVLPAATTVSALLVVNYDINTHPSNRPRLYAAGEDEHIVETAIEQGIGLLSTVELHKIVVAVKEGLLSKASARELVRRSGRIEYETETNREKA